MNGDNPYQMANTAYGMNPVETTNPDQTVIAGDTGELIKDTTTAAFKADVIDESRKQPVLVDFWAPWCGPCKQLGPIIEKVVREARGQVKLVKMNIDEHPQIAGQLGVQSIPAVFAFVNGQPVDGFMGAQPETEIRKFIEKVAGPVSDPIADALHAAQEAAEAGDVNGAMQIFGMILQQQPDHAEALGGAALLLYDNGQKDKAEELLARVPDAKRDIDAVKLVLARIALDAEVAELGDPVDLERRISENENDHAARLDLAKIENARGHRDRAADHLLRIIRTDREWNDDAARAQLLIFFEAWGMTDPATLTARRKLSSLLFS